MKITFTGRTGKKIRLSNAHSVFGQQRETIDEAYAGDIVGLIASSAFQIGDTLTEDDKIIFEHEKPYLWISYELFWNVFEKECGMKHVDIQVFIKEIFGVVSH